MVASALDTYIIYHIEVDLQKIVAEYEENQIDSLKEKIKAEANKVKEEKQANQNVTDNNNNNNVKKQEALSQSEIDELLHKNSLDNKQENESKLDSKQEVSKSQDNDKKQHDVESKQTNSTAKQHALTQAEIDELLKKNSNFYKDESPANSAQSQESKNSKPNNKNGTKK